MKSVAAALGVQGADVTTVMTQTTKTTMSIAGTVADYTSGAKAAALDYAFRKSTADTVGNGLTEKAVAASYSTRRILAALMRRLRRATVKAATTITSSSDIGGVFTAAYANKFTTAYASTKTAMATMSAYSSVTIPAVSSVSATSPTYSTKFVTTVKTKYAASIAANLGDKSFISSALASTGVSVASVTAAKTVTPTATAEENSNAALIIIVIALVILAAAGCAGAFFVSKNRAKLKVAVQLQVKSRSDAQATAMQAQFHANTAAAARQDQAPFLPAKESQISASVMATAIPEAAPASFAEQLRSLAELKAQGILTDEEFATGKAKVLSEAGLLP